MHYYTDYNSYEGTKRSAVTLGKFDSLHRGHQKLISAVKKYASREDLTSIVFSFDMGKQALLTNEERRAFLEDEVDCLIQNPFVKEIREMDAETFIKEVLVNKLHAAYIIVGTDFRFGYKATGDVKMLARYEEEAGYHLIVVDKEMYQDREISSTYVRELLKEGNVELANKLLGYVYSMEGTVEHGKKLGRTLGFPTMNAAPAHRKIMPKFGVYACRVEIDGVWYYGIGNVGIKPTVTDKKKLLVEVFVFGYNGNAYDKEIKVEFCAFERPETKFGSIEELKKQVDNDIVYGMNYFHIQDVQLKKEIR